jgi:hypothetical protein
MTKFHTVDFGSHVTDLGSADVWVEGCGGLLCELDLFLPEHHLTPVVLENN